MKLKLIFCLLASTLPCCTTMSNAGEIEGVVVIVGSAPNARPVVEPNGPKSQIDVCPGPQQDFLRKFGGTFVKGTGEWGQHSVTKERCFNMQSFHVTQLIKGRPAYTGTLSNAKDGPLALVTADGKRMTLENPPKGVAQLAGKGVIMDILPSGKTNAANKDQPLWKVVSYMEQPQP